MRRRKRRGRAGLRRSGCAGRETGGEGEIRGATDDDASAGCAGIDRQTTRSAHGPPGTGFRQGLCMPYPHFPTRHVHDGIVHKEARFAHSLYCQAEAGWTRRQLLWGEEGPRVVAAKAASRSRGLVEGVAVYRRSMVGQFPNQDIWNR